MNLTKRIFGHDGLSSFQWFRFAFRINGHHAELVLLSWSQASDLGAYYRKKNYRSS